MSRVIVDSLISVAFAPVCVSCAQVLESPTRSPVCERCWRNLRRYTPPWCATCGAPVARADAPHECLPSSRAVSALRALGAYDGVLRDLLHALKFDRRRSLAARLGALLRASDDEIFRGADALVPVPLHPWRHWRRGFNQAADLANALRAGALPVWPAVRRRRSTRPQFELDADRRHANVREAFAICGWTPWQRARWARRIAGRTLVLVDDVTTTGATLQACAEVLLRHGAKEVRAVTIGRVVLDRS
jgi:ComF family protein